MGALDAAELVFEGSPLLLKLSVFAVCNSQLLLQQLKLMCMLGLKIGVGFLKQCMLACTAQQ